MHMRTTLLATIAALAALAVAAPAPAQTLVGRDGAIDLNRFYTADETNAILAEWARLYPELTELYSIGRSYLGAELMVLEVTAERTGPAAEKPALYVDGGLHAAELTGSAVAMHLLERLLRGYGTDERITRLLDTRAFYVRPKFNPDGSDLVLTQDQPLRSSVRPIDEDDDGLADEDPPNDLDGDGRILQMRYRGPDGAWIILTEGIDDDGDGLINEDGIGGLDLNRNFPRNWEREHLQPGAGPFPLSEPETYAAVRFLSERPNVTGIVHGHTSGGFVYRLPSAVDPALLDGRDLGLIEHLGAEYTSSTSRPVRPSATHPVNHRYGTLISWGYWDRGVIGWVPEYVPADSWVTDYDGNGEISEEERRRFDREELGGRYFKEWTPFEHPQLGTVEIGGWHRRYWGQNPPAEFLERETEQQLHWILYLAEQSPLVRLEVAATPRADGDVRVVAEITNDGFLPTPLTVRGHVGRETPDGELVDQVVRPPEIRLELDGAELVEGSARLRTPHLAGADAFTGIATERSRTVTWVVRPLRAGATARVILISDTGGTRRSEPVPLRR
jgi:murein tripeptide amidase MpaA